MHRLKACATCVESGRGVLTYRSAYRPPMLEPALGRPLHRCLPMINHIPSSRLFTARGFCALSLEPNGEVSPSLDAVKTDFQGLPSDGSDSPIHEGVNGPPEVQ